MLTYAFVYGIGIGSVVFTLLGELLPDVIRNLGTSVATFVRYFSVFLLLKLFPEMTRALGLNGLFWFHSIFCVLGAIFVHFCVEETKGVFRVEEKKKKEKEILV